MMAQPDESQYVYEIEQLIPSSRTDYCLPSIAVAEANNSRAGTEMVISGNSTNVVSGINVAAHPSQNGNVTSQPNSISTPAAVPNIGFNNSTGQNQPVQPSSTHMPSYMAPSEGSSLCNSIGQNQSIQPSSTHMPSYMAPPEGSSLRNSIGQNQSVQPSSTHMPSYMAPPEGSSLRNSIGQNQSIQPSSIHMPSYMAPPEGSSLCNSIGQNQSVQPSSTHMPSYMAPPEGSGPHSSIGQNQSVQPSSIHMPSYMAPPEGSSLCNSIGQNQSVQPSSTHMPSHIAPAEGSSQQQIQIPATHRQPEAGRTQVQSHQQPKHTNKEDHPFSSQQGGLSFVNESHSQGSADLTRRPPDGNYTSLQHSDNVPAPKVFILHSIPENSRHSNALRSFAEALRDNGINVSIDLFELDKTQDNWSMWYEREILSSKVVLCIITTDFYKSITEHNRIKGYAVYNLMGDPTKDIAFRAVFLDVQKNMEDIPLSMRGATCYCISSNDLNVPDNDEFTNLYAFLTGQNRIEKPKLGKVVKLAPKKSRCKLEVCFHSTNSTQYSCS